MLVTKFLLAQILSNEKFEESVLKLPHGQPLLRELRLQAVRHYITCVDMIRKQYKSEDMFDEVLTADGTKDELLRKLEFLLLPVSSTHLLVAIWYWLNLL